MFSSQDLSGRSTTQAKTGIRWLDGGLSKGLTPAFSPVTASRLNWPTDLKEKPEAFGSDPPTLCCLVLHLHGNNSKLLKAADQVFSRFLNLLNTFIFCNKDPWTGTAAGH